MDCTDELISFDSSGICDHCRTFDKQILPKWKKGENRGDELQEIIDKIKKNGSTKEFDCILGMSGGVDSTYLLHKAVTEFGLRPLVFHVDGGWNTDLAVENIENIVNKLNLDLYTEVINWKEMCDLQLSFFKSGVPHVDTPQDHAFFATMYKFAEKYGIKSIITGGNYSTEAIRNPKNWMYYQSDTVQIKAIHKKYGRNELNKFPLTNIFWYKVYLPLFKNIKLYRLLDYIPYDKENSLVELESLYDYRRYPQKHFESRFTRFYESYWLPERFGYDVRRVQYSSLILTGQMTRETALKLLESPPATDSFIRNESIYIANKLNISLEELDTYQKLPLRTYRDFKNIDKLYSIGATVFRYLGKELGGKR